MDFEKIVEDLKRAESLFSVYRDTGIHQLSTNTAIGLVDALELCEGARITMTSAILTDNPDGWNILDVSDLAAMADAISAAIAG